MEGLLARLARSKVLVGDGALGTQLMQRGLPSGEPPERFVLERPDALEEVAGLYLEAGADLVMTNTVGGNSLRLALHGLAGEHERINREAVLAVRRVVGERAFVSASVGPSGRMLKPLGDTSTEEVEASFTAQIEVLTAAGADVICVETMSDIAEATLAVRAAKKVAPSVPVIATMTFSRRPRGFFTVMGASVEKAVVGLTEAGADVVGSNCGNGIEDMVEVARAAATVATVPLAMQPNAGLPEPVDGKLVYRQPPEAFASHVHELLDLGVAIVGGCCGTAPEHIRAVRREVDLWLQKA